MNGKLIKIIAIVVYLVGSLVSSAQTQIKGTVADGADGKPVLYCNCVLLKAQDSSFAYGATTDDKGKFVFKQVAKGDYLMRISYVGFEPFWQTVQVAGSASPLDLGKLSLKRASTVLDAVTVTAKKPLYAVDGEKNMYNTTEDPSIQNGTASDALQNAPGVEVDAEGNITLRGVSSVEIWINDRPSNMNAEALKQYIKQLPANAIDRIEVITNP
ncbi:MAG: carboxypeptidase regulatory-like domain-containing protein, partial [Bacteroidales bacterium]|nr:carboxypeptidase regulatory-like domain-containing protein [Bacteroidales bacterium]